MMVASAPLDVSRDGWGYEQVSDLQRARMLSAMVDVVSENGAGNVTVTDVVSRSGVSRRTFYELFEDREDCFLAALDRAVAHVASEVVPAFDGNHRWRERIRTALTVLLGLLDAEPAVGRLVIVESLSAGPRVLQRRSQLLGAVIAAVDEGRVEGKANTPPPLTAEGAVGAVLAVIHARLLEGSSAASALLGGPSNTTSNRSSAEVRGKTVEPNRLLDLVNQLMSMIVLPYMGSAAARRELTRPAPQPYEVSQPHSEPDPFRDLHMRFTYRTVRVLMAIAADPGASNKQIGEGSGAEDQGQISKLLSRLERLGLIENKGGGWGRGEPNAWRLTPKGVQVTQTISAHAHNNREVA
jgi:AcrR family transcriptional regulator/DNA-binding MarR family transcriptional regulator